MRRTTLQLLCACASLLCALLPPARAQQKRPELVLQTGHASQVVSAAFTSDAKYLATAGADGVKLWEVSTGRVLRSFAPPPGGRRASVAFSPDDSGMAWGYSEGGGVEVRDARSGEIVRQLSGAAGAGALRVAYSPDGRLLAVSYTDRTVRMFDARTGAPVRALEGFHAPVTGLAFGAGGARLTTVAADPGGGGGQGVAVWDVSVGRRLHAFAVGSGGRITLSGDGSTAAQSGRAGPPGSPCVTTLYDVRTGRVARQFAACSPDPVAVSFDGNLVAVNASGALEVWDARAGAPVGKFGGATPAGAVAFSRDGRTIAAGAFDFGKKATVSVFEVRGGNRLRAFEANYAPVYSVAFSPRGNLIALGGGERVRLWDGQSGVQPPSRKSPAKEIAAAVYSPDGRTLAAVASDSSVALLDAQTGAQLFPLEGRVNGYSVSFSPDGRLLAAGDGTSLKLWDTRGGALAAEHRAGPERIGRVAFSPDGRTIACAEGPSVRLRAVRDGKVLRVFAGHAGSVSSVAFSPDGRLIASGGSDKTVRLWDARGGGPVRTLEGNAANVPFVAFSPDGRLVASGGFDKKVRLWDAGGGQLLRELEGYHFAFSPDGRLIAAGTDDGESSAGSRDASTRLYDSQTGELLASLVLMPGDDWLVVTPDGLFDGSPRAWTQVLWRYDGDTFDVAPVEWFFNEFFRPGLLAELFAGGRPRAPKDFARLTRCQPRIRILPDGAQAAPEVVAARRVKVRLEVTEADAQPAGCGAFDLRLFRNGTLVRVWRGDVLAGRRSAALDVTLPVVAGPNNLVAYAFNRENVKSINAVLNLRGADALAREGTAHVLAVGVNRYANPDFNLRFAVADAQVFAEEFRRQQERVGLYRRVEVLSLTDGRATKSAILGALAELAGKAQPEDAVVVYFAGHGTAHENRFYLMPHDLGYAGRRERLDEAGLRSIAAHGVSDRELEQAFEKIDAGRLLLVLDACNSGQALESEEARRGPMNSRGLAQLAYEKGMYVLTAAQSYQAALEASRIGHGLLTYALVVEGLSGGAADFAPRDGEVRLREWFDYAAARVPEMQVEEMRRPRRRGLVISFAGGERELDVNLRSAQRPRVFYRREIEQQTLVVGRP